jgi:hypothetical protein
MEEACKFHAYNVRDFRNDSSIVVLTTHDVYFMTFFIPDETLQRMLNSRKFTIFNRSGLTKMFKVSSEYFLSVSEMRLHEVSCMTFNAAAYWSAVQHTSWSDFHNIFNAVQSEFQKLKNKVTMLNLPWGWFHLWHLGKDP